MISNAILYKRYRVVEELGSGGFGTTYLVEDLQQLGVRRVVKQLKPNAADIETAKRLFEREAQILNLLQDTHSIPRFYDYFEENGSCYIVEEFINGSTLDVLIEQSQWTEEKVVHLLREILVILDFIHKKNLIHRDIKPSNIIKVDSTNKYALIDFGAVKQIDHQKNLTGQKFTNIYTPGYSPPEQINGHLHFSSDIYSLGMTIVHILTGEIPTQNFEKWENMLCISVNQELIEIVQKMIQAEQVVRYCSAAEVLKDLDNKYAQNSHNSYSTTTLVFAPTKPSVPSNKQKIFARFNSILTHLKPSLSLKTLAGIGVGLILVEFLIHPFIRPWYYLQKGDKLLKEDNAKEAFAYFKKADRLSSSFDSWIKQGDALFQMGSLDMASDAYDRALKIDPKDTIALIQKARTLYLGKTEEKYQEALTYYEKAQEIEPKNAIIWQGKELCYIALKEYDEANNSFKEARALKFNDPNILLEQAIAFESSGKKEEAKQLFSQALSAYDDALDEDDKNKINWSDRGNVLMKLGKYDEALESYNKALVIDPKFSESLIGKGNALWAKGKPQEAKQAFELATKVDKTNAELWYNLGIILVQAEQKYQEGLTYFEQAIKLKNDFYQAWLYKGITLLELNENEKALAALTQAEQLNSKDPYLWETKGEVLENLGRNREAQEAYAKADEIE
jgi:serine/threonine protein kinase